MKKRLSLSCIFAFLFLLLIAAVKLVDIAPIGPDGTSVGLSTLNGAFHTIFGYNDFFYTVSDIMGYGSLIIGGMLALAGFLQLFKRKSLAKVDVEILSLGVLYIVTIGLYVIFEKVIINYRPVIMPDCTEPEASFPSSHTLLSLVMIGSLIMLIDKYVTKQKPKRILKSLSYVYIFVMVTCRLLSGAHWLSDIAGGILLGLSLLSLYSAILKKCRSHSHHNITIGI